METLFQLFILLYNNKCSRHYFFHVCKVKLLFGEYNYTTNKFKSLLSFPPVSLHKLWYYRALHT